MNSGLVMIVCLLASAAAREDCPTCSAGGAAAEDDEVSLLQARHTKRHLQHAADAYNGDDRGGVLVNASELLAEATVLDDEMGKCETRRCNPIECGTTLPAMLHAAPVIGAGTYAPLPGALDDDQDTVQKISSGYCLKAFNEATCCKERYGQLGVGHFYLRKFSRGNDPTDVCASCTRLDAVGFARTVRLYFMRHAEGCHNLVANTFETHTHKSPFGGGHYDAPLTQAGLDQAGLAIGALAGVAAAIDAVIVSPMRRAQQTYAVALGQPPQALLAALPTRVAPFACEGGSFGPENTPTAPAFQHCLMNQDNAAVPAALAPNAVVWPNIQRCLTWNTLTVPGGGPQMNTCTNGNHKYEEAPKSVLPQDFADWLTMEYGGDTVLLIGHSNWARGAGIVQANGDKVNWASINHLDITPGGVIREDAAASLVQDFLGTPRHMGSGHRVTQDPRCQADVAWVTTCKTQLGHAWNNNVYAGL